MTSSHHWESIYGSKAGDEMSWAQEHPETSLRLIGSRGDRTAIVDVGAGVATLADHLLEAEWSRIILLDLSEAALQVVCCRLADQCGEVELVTGDVLMFTTDEPVDVWHDRAVFHFLHGDDRLAYVATAAHAVKTGGHLVIATFADDGPEQCSGLPTSLYSPDDLAAVFAPEFELVTSEREVHVTPWGTEQPFTWAVLRRT